MGEYETVPSFYWIIQGNAAHAFECIEINPKISRWRVKNFSSPEGEMDILNKIQWLAVRWLCMRKSSAFFVTRPTLSNSSRAFYGVDNASFCRPLASFI